MAKNFGIFYFSGTGNTWWAARQTASGLEARGWRGRIISIETVTPPEAAGLMEKLDLVLFGYPVYASDLPMPMWDFLGALPDRKSPVKPAGVFCTQWLFSGDGAILPRLILENKGFRQDWAVHLRMPNNICVPQSPLGFSADYQRHRGRREKTQRKIDQFCARLSRGERWLQGRNRFWTSNALLQRRPYRKYFPRWRDDFSVDSGCCTFCGRCEKICPVENIIVTGDGVRFKGECVLCLRCYNYCPAQAIMYRGKKHNLRRGLPFHGPVREFRPELLRPGSGPGENLQEDV